MNPRRSAEVIKFLDINKKIQVFTVLDQSQKKQILSIESDINLNLINMKTSIYKIGKLLHQAKIIIPHGQFQRWIEQTWGDQLPYPTAACYKSVYETFGKMQGGEKLVRLLPLTILIQLKQNSFPDEIRKIIEQNPEAFSKMNPDDFKEIYDNFKNNKIDLNEFMRLAKKQIEIGWQIFKGDSKVRNSLCAKRTIKVGFHDLLKSIKRMRSYVSHIRKWHVPAQEQVDAHNYRLSLLNQTVDDGLIREIDKSIAELKCLKSDIEKKYGFFRDRLVVENGVIERKMLNNMPIYKT